MKPILFNGDMVRAILYVRDTWCSAYDGERYFYFADKNTCLEEKKLLDYDDVRWRHSIHMPKEAGRIFLRVTKVSVERLQEIKNDQAVDEGAVRKPNYTKRGDLVLHNRYRKEFSEIWDITIKKADRALYGWEANPWVWVIEFERISKEEAER